MNKNKTQKNKMSKHTCVDCGKSLEGTYGNTKRCPTCRKKHNQEMKRVRAAKEYAKLKELPAKEARCALPNVKTSDCTSMTDTRRTHVFDGHTCRVQYRGSGFYAQ